MITRTEYKCAQKKAIAMIQKAGIKIKAEEISGISVADFGLSNLEAEGAQILTFFATERLSAKVITLFSGQTLPEHWHPPVEDDPGKQDQINDKADYRAFCRSQGIIFTAGYLSIFRKYHLTVEIAEQLHQDILSAMKIQSSTASLRIGIWDSVPMPGYSSPYKDTKHCDCEKPCDCPKHFSDEDATIGRQSPTATRKDKFLGYRKHTILLYDEDKDKRLPIATRVQSANKADIELMEEILKQCIGKLHILLVDKAIYDFQQILEWYESYQILVLVKPRRNAVLSEYPVNDTATPCCPQQEEPLQWSHLDWEDKVHIYNCIQPNCIYSQECSRQFEMPMDQHPSLLGVFPAHTRCGRFLLSLRGLIEPEFGVQTLWSKLKRLPFRRLLNFSILAQLIDTATMLRKVVNANA